MAETWNWFMTVNAMGKWIATAGQAEVTIHRGHIEAILRLQLATDPYHLVTIGENEAGETYAEVRSPGEGRAEPFHLKGLINSSELVRGEQVTSIILSDGFTVLGLAKGQWSGQANMV